MSACSGIPVARPPATIFYVAPAGYDGGPGTVGRPFATVQHALDVASSGGDVVFLRAGTYAQDGVTFTHDGSPGRPITLAAYPGERPLITRRSPSRGNDAILAIRDRKFVRVEGLHIGHVTCLSKADARPCYGLLVSGSGSGVSVTRNVFEVYRGALNAPIWVQGTRSHEPIDDISIDHNVIRDAILTDTQALTVADNVEHFTVDNNDISDVDNIMIDVVGQSKNCGFFLFEPHDGVVSSNYLHDAHSADGRTTLGLYVDVGSRIVFERNTVRNTDQGLDVNREDKCGRPPVLKTEYVTVENNTFDHELLWGVIFGGDNLVSHVVMRNNTLRDSPNATFFDGHRQSAGSVAWGFVEESEFLHNAVVGHGHFPIFNTFAHYRFAHNRSNDNTFYDETIPNEAKAKFWWAGRDYIGFAAYQLGSAQDHRSQWGTPAWGKN